MVILDVHFKGGVVCLKAGRRTNVSDGIFGVQA